MFKGILLLAKELGDYIVLEVNCSGETEAGSISNHWRQTCVLLSRKQGSMTPWRNLPMCFIGLICCLTSLSPSCSCFLFCPRPQPIHQRLFLCLPPTPSPSISLPLLPSFPFSHTCAYTRRYPAFLPASLCVLRKLIMRDFSAEHHLWGLFYLTPVLPRKAL